MSYLYNTLRYLPYMKLDSKTSQKFYQKFTNIKVKWQQKIGRAWASSERQYLL